MAKWPYNTRQWKRLRALKLATEPFCEFHLKRERLVPAVAVDHVVSIASGGDPFPDLEGLTSLCAACHNHKTNVVDRPNRGRSNKPVIKGCDVNGYPIDPNHPWRKDERH